MKGLILSLLFLLVASQADAASTWWLRPTGGTTGTCAQAKGATDPGFYLRSFAALNACSGPAFVGGDTVMLKAGTYTEFAGSGGYTIPNGSAGAPTILQAVGTEVVLFTGAGGPADSAFYLNGKSYISLIGDIQAKNFQINMNSVTCLSALQLSTSNHIVMRGLDVGHCNSGNGLSIFFGGGNNTLQHSRFHHHGGVQVGTEQSHAIYLDTSNNVLDNLELDNNSGYGLHCNDAALATDNVFSNLNIHHNGTTSAAGLLVCKGLRNKYYNMKIWNNTATFGAGIQIDGGSDAVLKSITLYNNTYREIFIRAGVTGATFENFIISNSIGSTIIADAGSGNTYTKVHCLAAGAPCTSSGNPLFVQPAIGDFHLQTGSPVKTGGSTLGGIYATDFDNVSRPQGATYAFGAFERVETPTPTLLVLQLSGDDVATDSSGQANHGTLTGGATYTAVRYNSGFSLDGTNDYVSVAHHSTLSLAQFTIMGWVKLPTVDAVDRVLIAKSGSYFLYATSSNPSCLGGIRGGFVDVATGVKSVCYATPLSAATLAHIALTYDGTTLKLYVGGVLVTSQAEGGTVQSNSNAVAVGSNGTGGEFLQGGVDEVHIDNFALTAGQIVTRLNTSINPVVPPSAPGSMTIGTGAGALKCGTGAGACKFGVGS